MDDSFYKDDFTGSFFNTGFVSYQYKINTGSHSVAIVISSIPYGLSAESSCLINKPTGYFSDFYKGVGCQSPDTNLPIIAGSNWIGKYKQLFVFFFAFCCSSPVAAYSFGSGEIDFPRSLIDGNPVDFIADQGTIFLCKSFNNLFTFCADQPYTIFSPHPFSVGSINSYGFYGFVAKKQPCKIILLYNRLVCFTPPG